jgi:hypothetical protein
VYVAAAEMARRVRAQVLGDYTPARARIDERVLGALGVLEPGTDLRAAYAEFVGGQVAGYYDPDSGEMVVLGDAGEPFDALELATISLELEHALADQALGIPAPAADETGADLADEQLAATAVVEGDAMLTMTVFQLRTLDLEALLSLGLGGDATGSLRALDDAPHFLAAQLLFPYTEGLAFVCSRHTEGGWRAVDLLYDAPPRDTAQILFPERPVPGGQPSTAPSPSPPGDGWRRAHAQSLGAADLLFLFQAPGDDTGAALDDPRGRAAAWGAGSVTLWERGGDTHVDLSLRARTPSDAPALCESMREWARRTDERRDGTRAVECDDRDVRVAIDAGS